MLRVVLVFLVVLAVLGMVGKWIRPALGRRPPPPPVEQAHKCPDCDAYVLGPEPAPCERPECRYRA